MDIAKLSMETAQASIKDAVGTALLSKAFESAKTQSDGLLRLLGSASAAAPLPAGSGTRVDLFA